MHIGATGAGRDRETGGNTALGAPKKKNPAVGTPGQIFIVIGVYGFKYAA
jgi:hypothetical protein